MSNSLRPKKARRSKSKIKSRLLSLLFFFTVKVLFIRNLCHKDQQLINSTIMRSLNDSEKGFIVSGKRLRTLGCDFFLFPKLKFHLIGHYFETADNVQKVVTDQLRALPHEDFQHCYQEWEQHLRRCMASQGNYFKGDNTDLYFSC